MWKLFLAIFTILSLTQITVSAPIDVRNENPFSSISWITDFRGRIVANTVMELEWTGGSGRWEVFYIPQWDGQASYTPVDIALTRAYSIKWRTPAYSLYPSGTTFIMVIKVANAASGSKWFQTTGLLDFVES